MSDLTQRRIRRCQLHTAALVGYAATLRIISNTTNLDDYAHEGRRETRPFGEGLDRRIWKVVDNAEDTNTYMMAFTAVFLELIYVLDVFVKKAKSGNTTPKVNKDRVAARFSAAQADSKTNFGAKK